MRNERKKKITNKILILVLAILLTWISLFAIKPSWLFKEKQVAFFSQFTEDQIVNLKVQDNNFVTLTDDPQIILSFSGKYDAITINYDQNSLENNPVQTDIFFSLDGIYRVEDCKQGEANKYNYSISFTDMSGRNSIRIDTGRAEGITFHINSIELYNTKVIFDFASVCILILVMVLIYAVLWGIEYVMKSMCLDTKELILFLGLCLCLYYYILLFLTEGRIMGYVFLNDTADTFMDYFHSLANNRFGNPYNNYSSYPAFALLIYRIMYNALPNSLRNVDGFELRQAQSAMLLFFITNIIILFAVLEMINRNIKLSQRGHLWLKLTVLLCAPMAFAIERGNIILLSFALSLFFVFYYNSKSKTIREIAFLSLACAAGLKIYPAILGLILVKEKRWKETVRLLIYGVIVFFLPFAFFDGIHGMKTMLTQLSTWTSETAELGYGLNMSLNNIIKLFGACVGWNISDSLILILNIIFILLIVCTLITTTQKYIYYLALTLLIIMLPKTSYFYTCIFLFIPFLELLSKDIYIGIERKKQLFTYITIYMILVPWPFGLVNRVSAGVKYVTSYGMLLQNVALIGMLILIAEEGLKNIWGYVKHKKRTN